MNPLEKLSDFGKQFGEFNSSMRKKKATLYDSLSHLMKSKILNSLYMIEYIPNNDTYTFI